MKTFYREADRVRLQPENDTLEPIYADHVQILGKVPGFPDALMTVSSSTAPSTRSWPRSRGEPASSASVCGEFLLKRPVALACLECGTLLCDGLEDAAIAS